MSHRRGCSEGVRTADSFVRETHIILVDRNDVSVSQFAEAAPTTPVHVHEGVVWVHAWVKIVYIAIPVFTHPTNQTPDIGDALLLGKDLGALVLASNQNEPHCIGLVEVSSPKLKLRVNSFLRNRSMGR